MRSIELREPYHRREIRYLELWRPPGWRLKVYGIAHHRRDMPAGELLGAAKELAVSLLPADAPPAHYGVGCLTLHAARDGNYLLLDWWAGENSLYQEYYKSPLDRPTAFESISVTRHLACVWELLVHCFERQAWLDTVLANPAGPDLDAYLERRLNEWA